MNAKMSESGPKPACSTKYDLFPVTIACGKCGLETETWEDEEETACRRCGESLKHKAKG